ncbi:MAG: hypothetical protein WA940_04880 [Sphingopyxis sp.]
MAYLAVNEALDFALSPGIIPSLAPAASKARPAAFSALEWSVVMLARHDRPSSLRAPGRIARLLALLFGEGANRRLADPKLEALRRMAVLTWHHGYTVSSAQIAAFLAAGYSPDHYDLLGRRIAQAHGARLFRR